MTVAVRTPSAEWASRVPEGPGADAAELVAALRGRCWLVLTGAGMSTASGIPDYRGPDGTRRVQPMTIQEFRASSAARRRYWARSHVGWRRLSAVGPNAAHQAVAALQRRQLLGPVITQNVDGLHQAAGATDVVELHGSLSRVGCDHCALIMERTSVDRLIIEDNPDFSADSDEIRPDGDISLLDVDVERFTTPQCPRCGHDQLRPDVVFFGDTVPRDRVDRCRTLVDTCDGLLVLGSSLAVMSGLRFVRAAARRGVPVVMISAGPSRADDLVTVRSHRPLEVVLPTLVGLCAGTRGGRLGAGCADESAT